MNFTLKNGIAKPRNRCGFGALTSVGALFILFTFRREINEKSISIAFEPINVIIFSSVWKFRKNIIGDWYNAEENDYLIVQSDNTYRIKHHPGAMGYEIGADYGTWKWLEDEEVFKLIDANGDTHEVIIEKDQGTEKIKYYYYGYFTKQ